jgi:2-dehydro-3-deoxyphosphooctonate aldolase (KDO 8-P synthase)
MVFEIAKKMKTISERYNIDFYFKASFDKANRSSIHSFRGPGMNEGMRILKNLKDTLNLKIVTDIHEASQANFVAGVADMIQIPAFLCRQTDLLVAAAKTGKIVNVKKGQFLAPWDMKNVLEKIEESGSNEIFLTERGTSFGYNRLVVDMTSIIELKKFNYPVIFDATHSVQLPGGNADSTGGNREYVYQLAKAAVSMGADGIFMEVHPDPDNAKSDGPNMIKLSDVEEILKGLTRIYSFLKEI